MPTPISYQRELIRKSWHFVGLSIPMGILFLGPDEALRWLIPITLFFAVADVLRIYWGPWTKLYGRLFGAVTRKEERNRLNGSTYLLAGAMFTTLIFHDAALAALGVAFTVIGDAAAALVGRKVPIWKVGNKSLGGMISCMIGSLLVGVAFLTWSDAVRAVGIETIAVGAVVATIAEAMGGKLNDNLSMPLFSALAMDLVR